VVGIQIEGSAKELVFNEESGNIASAYAIKFGRSKQWVNDFCSNKTDHKLYRIKPKNIVLFDEVNFPDNSRQEYKLTT